MPAVGAQQTDQLGTTNTGEHKCNPLIIVPDEMQDSVQSHLDQWLMYTTWQCNNNTCHSELKTNTREH